MPNLGGFFYFELSIQVARGVGGENDIAKARAAQLACPSSRSSTAG